MAAYGVCLKSEEVMKVVGMLPDRMVQRGQVPRRRVLPAIPNRTRWSRWAPLLVAALLLSACADDKGGHVAATTLMGGALGIPAGPIGIAVGAGAGAVAGAAVPKEVFEGSSENDRH
jgi:hypothetical protein